MGWMLESGEVREERGDGRLKEVSLRRWRERGGGGPASFAPSGVWEVYDWMKGVGGRRHAYSASERGGGLRRVVR